MGENKRMSRKYVIMRDNQDEYEYPIIEPVDVVSYMTVADLICREEEQKALEKGESWVYYWREVISSED